MNTDQEKKVLASLYDRLFQAVTYSQNPSAAIYDPSKIHFQMGKNEVLSGLDFQDAFSPLNPAGKLVAANAFSTMVDRLPVPGELWADSKLRLSAFCRDVLAQAVTNAQPSAEQQRMYDAAYAFLNVIQKEPPAPWDAPGTAEKESVGPSAVTMAYRKAQSAYARAICDYGNAYIDYDLTKREDQRQWNAKAPLLQNMVDQAWDAWEAAGKARVESAQNAMASTINNAISHAIGQLRKAVAATQAGLGTTPTPWLLSYALPSDWASSTCSGTKLTLKSSSLDKQTSKSSHEYAASAQFQWGLWHASGGSEGNFQNGRVETKADSFELEAELIAVSINRDWFNPLLLTMNNWSVKGYDQNGISDGKGGGKVPLIPSAFVVARNVKVKADFSAEEKSFAGRVIKANASGGWGPFGLSTSYGNTDSQGRETATFEGGTLSFPGMQVVAWISTPTPASPPLNQT
jgi:hypothetical protein